MKIGARMNNARVESVTQRAAYRQALARRRALVPADRYYEWQKVFGTKVPHFLHHDGEQLAFAGLYEMGRDLTRSAPNALGHIHDRARVLVPAELHDDWLALGH